MIYAISPYNEPRLTIDPGDTVVIETEDAFSGQIRKEGDRRDLAKVPYSNPQSGPIYVEGAGRGDMLKIKIVDIKPLIAQCATRNSAWWWYLGSVETSLTTSKFLNIDLPHGTRICKISDGQVHFNEKIVLPFQPMIGVIGTAPELEAVSTYLPGPHGGNLDLPDVTIGNTIYLPVQVPGALLHVGDVHAAQGDGEFSGVALEMPAELTLEIDLVKSRSIRWPRIESSEYIMAVSASDSGRTLEDTIRLAFIELILWMETEYGFNRWEAYQLCTFLARVRLGNFWTVATKFPKKYLKAG